MKLDGSIVDAVPALPTKEAIEDQTPVAPKENRIAQIKGMTGLDAHCDREAMSIRRADAWRTERPKRRPRKTHGHGVTHLLLEDIGRKLKDKKPPELTKSPVVPDVKIPDFAMKLLRERPECDWLKGPLKDLNFGILSSPPG